MRNLIAVLAVALAFAVGFGMGRESVPTAESRLNDLMSVGFVVVDPEGFEVERWDE